jgi:hypothetical protein
MIDMMLSVNELEQNGDRYQDANDKSSDEKTYFIALHYMTLHDMT